MAVAIVLTPTGTIPAGATVRVDITGASTNDTTTYSTATYPTETPFTYYLYFSAPVARFDKKSYLFNVSQDGKHTFNSFAFDYSGSWTVRLRNAADDTDVATQTVTVA